MNENNKKHLIRKSTKNIKTNDITGSVPIRKPKSHSIREMMSSENAKYLIKRELGERLSKLFSSESSLIGYKYDIESLLSELYISKDDLFHIVLEFLSKTSKKEDEIRIIASYLFSMQGLTNLLLKTINLEEDKTNKEKHLLNDLLVLGSTLVYEKFPKSHILIRFGEKGSKAYINLSGPVAVLIKKAYKIGLTEEEYLLYLANLIKYNEYELVNLVINENYQTFPVKIIDDINEMDYSKKNIVSSVSVKDVLKFNNTFNRFQIDNLGKSYSLEKKSSKEIADHTLKNKNKEKLNKIKEDQKTNPKFKLNQENEKKREISSSPFVILASELMSKNNLKRINKKSINRCSVEEYIKRINPIKNFEYNEEEFNKKYGNEKEKIFFTIYSYIKVVELPKGSLFGEMALNNKNSQRNATIITLDECHCAVLNKKAYNNCLKNGAEKNLHDILYFIVELPIFKGIPTGVFFRKYYTSLSRNSIYKSNKIINQGEKPEYIILLKSGQYMVTTYNSLFNITNLMIYYLQINKKIRDRKNNINKVLIMLKETNKLISENEIFKNFYFSKNIYKIGKISYPDIIGYNEYLDQGGLYAFSIEPRTLSNDVFLLKNEFYEDIVRENEIVRNNQEEILYSKLDLLFERLYNMRNTEISTFLEYRAKEEIGATINKKINEFYDDKIKFKRTKKFNTIDNKIKLKENKHKNNLKINIENNYLDSYKKSNIYLKQSKEKMPLLNLKESLKTESNYYISSYNMNRTKYEHDSRQAEKFNKFLESTDNKAKIYSYNLSQKNFKNKTITHFSTYNSRIKIDILKEKYDNKKKIEKYSHKSIKNKKKKFDGVCLNNMILEDIKEKIKFSFNNDNKIIRRNKSNKIKKHILCNTNNVNNKRENEKSIPLISEDYLKTIKKTENTNKVCNSDRNIFNLKQYNEKKEKINYDIERNNYYKKTVSKRLNLFFGTKKFYNI